MRRLTLLAVSGALAVGAAAPALAQSITPPAASLPKPTVTYSTDGGIFVGTALGNQPLVGASVSGGRACVGFSFEVPFCTSLSTGSTSNKTDRPTQGLPVVIYHDSTKTAVGIKDIGVVVYNDGTICPVVSTQDWRCIPGIGILG